METRIDITAMEAGTYGVELTEGETTTNHRVEISPSVLDAVAPGEQMGNRELEENLVRESIQFLLEREPAAEILDQFSLDSIPRYFPDYSSEIVNRVSARTQ